MASWSPWWSRLIVRYSAPVLVVVKQNRKYKPSISFVDDVDLNHLYPPKMNIPPRFRMQCLLWILVACIGSTRHQQVVDYKLNLNQVFNHLPSVTAECRDRVVQEERQCYAHHLDRYDQLAVEVVNDDPISEFDRKVWTSVSCPQTLSSSFTLCRCAVPFGRTSTVCKRH